MLHVQGLLTSLVYLLLAANTAVDINVCLCIAEPAADAPDEIVFAWEFLNSFQKIMLIKVLRPDSLTSSLRIFIEEQMGDRYAKVSIAWVQDVAAA